MALNEIIMFLVKIPMFLKVFLSSLFNLFNFVLFSKAVMIIN